MDELARHRLRRRGVVTVPPMPDGCLETIKDDLVTIQGMATEVIAEAVALPVGSGGERVVADLNRMADAITRALATVEGVL